MGGGTRRAKCQIMIQWMWERTNERQRQKERQRERKRRKEKLCCCRVFDYKQVNNHVDDPYWGYVMYEIALPLSAIIHFNQEVAELFHCGAGC